MVSRNPKKSSGGKKILSLILVVLLAIVGYFYESNYNPETEKNVDWSTVTTVTPTETPATYSEVPKIDSKKLQITPVIKEVYSEKTIEQEPIVININ